jgi:beta-fructofuranosidase
MKMLKTLLFLAAAVRAQTAMSLTSSTTVATSTMFDEGVPTDQPVPGDYSGAWRPQVHFSPPTQFMNDPNGMFVDANGTYHLYYQCKSASSLPFIDRVCLVLS